MIVFLNEKTNPCFLNIWFGRQLFQNMGRRGPYTIKGILCWGRARIYTDLNDPWDSLSELTLCSESKPVSTPGTFRNFSELKVTTHEVGGVGGGCCFLEDTL